MGCVAEASSELLASFHSMKSSMKLKTGRRHCSPSPVRGGEALCLDK
jgi:hypothetical protein